MITQKDLVEIMLMIYNRDSRISDTINIYERFVDIIKTPYTGDTQYPLFIDFLKEFREDASGVNIVNTFYRNPGFINILKKIGKSNEGVALQIANLNHIITSQSMDIKVDFRYLSMYRKLYSYCVGITVNDDENISVDEATSYAAFILSAFECNPYLTPEGYRTLINALYESLFEFLFMGKDGPFIEPIHPFLKRNEGSNYRESSFRFDTFICHSPVMTKAFSSCSAEMQNIQKKTFKALDYISDFYWMVQKFDRGIFDDMKNLFDKTNPI